MNNVLTSEVPERSNQQLNAKINPEHLSGGEQVFIQQLQRKSENGQILKPCECIFIRDMTTRSNQTSKRLSHV